MTDVGIFIFGSLVLVVTVVGCVLTIGKAEAEDPAHGRTASREA